MAVFRESDVFRHIFEGVVQRCMTEGLVRAEGFAVDASIVKADANRRRGVPSEEGIDWSTPELGTRAVREYLLMAVETRAFLAMGAFFSCWLSRAIRG
jgi:hypothetical protein